jgi:hypothetical protein
MSDPFVFVVTLTINDGELENIKQLGKSFTELAEASDTGLLAFHFYLTDDGTKISNVQVHVDAASMDAYLPVVAEKIGHALELSQTDTIEVYGSPGPVLREVLRHNEEQGARVRVLPTHLDGFTHADAA